MALIDTDLGLSLSKMIDSLHPLFKGHPESNQDAAKNWANAICDYAAEVTPSVTEVSALAAKKVFEASVLGIIESQTFISSITGILTTYATALASGMAPSFIGTPPATPIDLSSSWTIIESGGTEADLVEDLKSKISAWLKTGTAVPSGGGASIPWS